MSTARGLDVRPGVRGVPWAPPLLRGRRVVGNEA